MEVQLKIGSDPLFAESLTKANMASYYLTRGIIWDHNCSGQLKLATVLEFSQYNRSESLGVRPPLY